jgi:uncharacterized protein (DUF362 family)
MKQLNRREFLRHLAALSATGLALSACGQTQPQPAATAAPAAPQESTAQSPAPEPTAAPAAPQEASAQTEAPIASAAAQEANACTANCGAYLAVARGAGADPAELTRRAIAALGGIERFVKNGADVIVKPNICNAYHGPEYASTTNPIVIATIVQLCMGAGAKRVRVMDFPFAGAAQSAYKTSGIEDAVKQAGGEMEAMSQMKYRKVALPGGKTLKEWDVYGDIMDADTVINVPIAKNHGSATLTLGMKNLMGVVENRNGMHARGLHQCIADLSTGVKPQLTVIDAVRMLMANGPTGGNLNDVQQADTVIASADVVAADTYAASLFNMTPADVSYIRIAGEMGLGETDLKAIKIEEIAV